MEEAQLTTERREPRFEYVQVFPAMDTLVQALGNVIESHPDGIILGVYDSGKTPDSLTGLIRTATSREIAVFGIRQTLLATNDIDLAYSVKAMDTSYEMQPEILRAGLVPLQGYPSEMVMFAEQMERLWSSMPHYSVKMIARVDGDRMIAHLFDGLRDICLQYPAYTDRVCEARQRFSSPGFNKRIDEALAQE
ncbi:hypothetical protein HYU19_01955 [Candidatus Woesearchaeota archaeon]|nr:hypothetical protein [Candidatus Woesearchaeota archaeon]